tara:strand:+ start:560 stop:1021 length:462 start_codon:yes stop_codon:yes gene_type:complete
MKDIAQSMSPEQIKVIDACVNKTDDKIELTLCVEPLTKYPSDYVNFNPKESWARDLVRLEDKSIQLGSFLLSESTPVKIDWSQEKKDWVTTGNYCFRNAAPKPKPAPKKTAPKRAAKKTTPKKTAPKKSAPKKAVVEAAVKKVVSDNDAVDLT